MRDPNRGGDGETDATNRRSDRRNAALRDDLNLILVEWESLCREEPWHIHPERYGVDSLHEAIRGVLDVALGYGGAREASERLVRAAAAHGDQRRLQAVHDVELLRE